jgi:hypothetical protein
MLFRIDDLVVEGRLSLGGGYPLTRKGLGLVNSGVGRRFYGSSEAKTDPTPGTTRESDYSLAGPKSFESGQAEVGRTRSEDIGG